MAERKIKQWITVNGVHVPIFEGESKSDAVKRAIDKAKSNAKANEDQKAKDIAKNEAEKDKLNGKSDNKTIGEVVNGDHKWVVDKLDGDRISATFYEKAGGKWQKLGTERWADRKEFEEEYGRIKEFKSDNAESGKSANKPTADDIKQAYKDAWDKKGSYSKIVELEKASGLSQRELAGVKNDANDEYDMAKSGKAVDEVRGNVKSTPNLDDAIKSAKQISFEQMVKSTDNFVSGEKVTTFKFNNRMPVTIKKNELPAALEKYNPDTFRLTVWRDKGGMNDVKRVYETGNYKIESVCKGTQNGALPAKDMYLFKKNSSKVPASFAANYPNLSPAQLRKKYEEFLKKNRK